MEKENTLSQIAFLLILLNKHPKKRIYICGRLIFLLKEKQRIKKKLKMKIINHMKFFFIQVKKKGKVFVLILFSLVQQVMLVLYVKVIVFGLIIFSSAYIKLFGLQIQYAPLVVPAAYTINQTVWPVAHKKDYYQPLYYYCLPVKDYYVTEYRNELGEEYIGYSFAWKEHEGKNYLGCRQVGCKQGELYRVIPYSIIKSTKDFVLVEIDSIALKKAMSPSKLDLLLLTL